MNQRPAIDEEKLLMSLPRELRERRSMETLRKLVHLAATTKISRRFDNYVPKPLKSSARRSS